jgi:hypothetical protein
MADQAEHSQEGAASPAAGDPVRSVRSALRGIATVVAPASLVTGLLYYFGWARTSYQAQALGLDDSLLGYSSQDYILRSLSSMFVPLAIGVVAALAALVSHGALVRWVERQGVGTRRPLRVLAATLAFAGAVLLVVGGAGARIRQPTRFVSLAAPASVTVAIALGGYAVLVVRRFVLPPAPGRVTPELASVGLVASSLFVLLLFLSVFWSVSHYAGVKGVDLALRVEQELPGRPDVTLYSGRRLYLQPPVRETELGQDPSSYRYQYSGLKLLFRSGKNYFLRPSDPSASDLNIVIPERDDIRLEFALPR